MSAGVPGSKQANKSCGLFDEGKQQGLDVLMSATPDCLLPARHWDLPGNTTHVFDTIAWRVNFAHSGRIPMQLFADQWVMFARVLSNITVHVSFFWDMLGSSTDYQ